MPHYIDGVDTDSLSSAIDYLIATVVIFIYEVVMLAEYGGQTIGKRVVGIKVVTDDDSKLTYGKVLLRIAGIYVSFTVLLLGYLWVIWDPKKQSWHDKIAKTLVIKTE